MPAVNLTPPDLAAFAVIDEDKALAMIEDCMAMAALVAPCILDPAFTHPAAAKAILRGAVLRWNESGSGAYSAETQTAGPFGYTVSMDSRQQRRGMFWPSEITQLQELCSTGKAGAFSVDTASTGFGVHSEICSVNFGATYCSCGAVLAGVPLYEQDI